MSLSVVPPATPPTLEELRLECARLASEDWMAGRRLRETETLSDARFKAVCEKTETSRRHQRAQEALRVEVARRLDVEVGQLTDILAWYLDQIG